MLNRLLPAAALAIVLLPSACTRVHSTKGSPEARGFFATGEAAAKAGKHAEAAAAFRQAIDADPDYVHAHQRFIETTRRIEAPASRTPVMPQLQQQYERWANEHPRTAAYRWALGFLSNDPATADRYFTEALRIDPTLARAHSLLAKNADLRGDFGAQRDHLQAAVESDPDDPQVLLAYAKALVRSDPARSREVGERVLQKFPGTQDAARALYDLAGAASNQDRRGYFERLRKEYPAETFNYSLSGMITLYGELTTTAEALALAKEMAARLPANKTWATRAAQQEAMARAEALLAERKFAEALQAIDTTQRPSGRHGTTWVLLRAEALAGEGHPDQAYGTVLDLLARAPDDRLQPAFEKYGAALKKTAGQQTADLWLARDGKATPAAPFERASSKDGKPVRLADYRGKVVLLAFWFPG